MFKKIFIHNMKTQQKRKEMKPGHMNLMEFAWKNMSLIIDLVIAQKKILYSYD